MRLIVIGFESTDPVKGRINRELMHLDSRGTIRFIEGLAIAKQRDGRVVLFGAAQLYGAECEHCAGVIGALIGISGSRVTLADAAGAALDALDMLAAAGLLDAASRQQAARLAEQKASETDAAFAALEALAQRNWDHTDMATARIQEYHRRAASGGSSDV